MATDARDVNKSQRYPWSAHALRAGMLAGLAGGVVMGLLALLVAAFFSETVDAWDPVKAIAGVFFEDALDSPGFDLMPVLAGTLIQFAVAMFFGALFAILYRLVLRLPFNLGLPYLMGGIYGLALWAGTNFTLPWINPVMAAADKPAFLLVHLAYGIVLGLAYARIQPKMS